MSRSHLQQHFDELAQDYARHYSEPVASPVSSVLRQRNQVALRFLREYGPQGGELLDVGCGPGAFTYEAAALGYPSTGLELSERMLEQARAFGRLFPDVESRVSFDLGDLFEMKYPKHRFAVVAALGVLELADNPAKMLARLSRWLEPGGLLLLSVPNTIGLAKWGGFTRLKRNIRHWLRPDPREIERNCYTVERVQRLLGMAGFIMRDYQRFGYVMGGELQLDGPSEGPINRLADQIVTASRTYRPDDTAYS